MANLKLSVFDARQLPWPVWAGGVVTDLLASGYNLPNPGEEGLWRDWATELLNITGISGLGLPDPRTFGDAWRDWAAAFILAAT